MNKQTFIQLIKDPSRISPEQLLELEKVVAGFPYCQDAHILIAKQAADNGSMLADQKVKKAAAYTLDRKNLKNLITGFKEKELPEVPLSQFRELPPVEKTVEETKPQEPVAVAEVQEEKPLEKTPANETVLPKEEKNEDAVSTKEEPNSIVTTHTNKEALSDEKRDQIIRELQENLKRLHDIKIKTAWEEVPEKLEVVGVDIPTETTSSPTETEEPVKTGTETPEAPAETSPEERIEEPVHEIIPATQEETNEIIPGENTTVNEDSVMQEILSTTQEEPAIQQPVEESTAESGAKTNDVYEWLNPQGHDYPVRTEDVVVAIKETEADASLLLEYIQYLEEKRSIFRKNKKKEEEIIDKIIKEDPTIPKLDINNLPDNSVDLSSKSSTISKGPVSENFAKILGLQGKKEKAIEIYEQLILKNPEKKPYFEAQIEKLKNKI